VTFKNLKAFVCFDIPKSSDFIKTCWEDFVTLRIEDYLGDFTLMALEDASACKCWYIINSACFVRTASHQTCSNCIKVEIKNFVTMSSQYSHTLSCTNIPQSACFINWWCTTNVPTELKLCAWYFSRMSL